MEKVFEDIKLAQQKRVEKDGKKTHSDRQRLCLLVDQVGMLANTMLHYDSPLSEDLVQIADTAISWLEHINSLWTKTEP